MNIEKGWLDKEHNIFAIVDPNNNPTKLFYSLETPIPIAIVWHYSSPKWYGKDWTAEMVCRTLLTTAKASFHIMITRDGTIFQNVSFLKGSFHVGRPGTFEGVNYDNINKCTIGIELENHGRLLAYKDKFYTWPYYKEGIIDPDLEVDTNCAIKTNEGWFCNFTDAQILSAVELMKALKQYIKPENMIFGHVDFDPGRKEDPGPIWKEKIKELIKLI